MPFENEEVLENQIDDVEDVETDGEQDLINAIKSLKESEENPTDDDDDSSEDEVIENDEVEETDDDVVDEEEIEEEPVVKKGQSKEENAKYAAQRRQRELEERLHQSPEYQLAQRLSDMYGKPVDEIMRELEESELQKKAEEEKVPVERLRKERDLENRANQQQEEINRLKFENWQSRIKSEGESLKKDYPMLSQEDMDGAVEYILYTARNVDMPLEQAVYALHGKKIIEAKANNKIQDDLAKQSGRAKKTPPSPNNGNPSKATATLTAEEKYIAKQFGMTEADYIKHKNQ